MCQSNRFLCGCSHLCYKNVWPITQRSYHLCYLLNLPCTGRFYTAQTLLGLENVLLFIRCENTSTHTHALTHIHAHTPCLLVTSDRYVVRPTKLFAVTKWHKKQAFSQNCKQECWEHWWISEWSSASAQQALRHSLTLVFLSSKAYDK